MSIQHVRRSRAVQAILDAFDALSELERHDAVQEILRRVTDPGDFPDRALVAAADELFQGLDLEEGDRSR